MTNTNKRSQAPSGFRFIDLFSGIGGFHLALEGLGGTCVLASEIDPDCQAVYRRRFPHTPLIGDIRALTARPDSIPEHDVLAAGFPCQPFSKSGAQLGLRDQTRGTLFFDIMEVVRARRPRYVILENVRNIAGPRHRETWRTVIESLREEGYSVGGEPLVLSPHLLSPEQGGAPQVRDRVFILAEYGVPTSELADLALLRSKLRLNWSPQLWRIEDHLTPDDAIDIPERYRLRPEEVRWLDAWNEFMQHLPADGLPGFPIWVEAFTRTPQVTDVPLWKAIFNRKNSALYMENRRWIESWLKRWRVRDFPRSRQKFEWQARGHEPDVWKLVVHLRPSGIRVKAATYLPALVAITQTSIIGSRRRRITPREAARLQSFPEDFQLHPVDAIAYRQLGNAVNVGVASFVAQELMGRREMQGNRSNLRLVS